MNYHISDLLDALEESGQPIQPKGGSAARVKALTLSRLGTPQAVPVPSARGRLRPLRGIAAAVAAVFLLGGTVFAAWKLGVFHFEDEFGAAGKLLDSHAQSYEPSDSGEAIPADYGYAAWVKAQLGDYNLVLLELSAGNGQLHATLDVSPKDESLPAFRDSGLTLAFADYKTSASLRQMQGWRDRVELSATLDESLAPDAEIAFSLSGSDQSPTQTSFRLNALEENFERLSAENRQHYATAAETQDYRFSLRSLAASPNVIYAVMDVEALTDWGAAHLDTIPEIAVSNHTHQNGGALLDARLVGSEDGVRRYIVGFLSNLPLNKAGDTISFEILELFEAGDAAGHPYYLFDVVLEDLIPAGIELSSPAGEPTGSITWQSVTVDELGMTVSGFDHSSYEPTYPSVVLIFRDGTQESVMDEDWHLGDTRSTHDAVASEFTGHHDGSAYLSLIFGQMLEPGELAAIVVDGQQFLVP